MTSCLKNFMWAIVSKHIAPLYTLLIPHLFSLSMDKVPVSWWAPRTSTVDHDGGFF